MKIHKIRIKSLKINSTLISINLVKCLLSYFPIPVISFPLLHLREKKAIFFAVNFMSFFYYPNHKAKVTVIPFIISDIKFLFDDELHLLFDI